MCVCVYRHKYIRAPRGSGSARAKRVLDALKNYTKANFQENFPGKAQFQIKWVAWPLWSPHSSGGLYIHTPTKTQTDIQTDTHIDMYTLFVIQVR